MAEAGIVADGLVKAFGAVKALDGVELEVAEGSVLGLLGPNGAGKTTAVRILATLLRPDAGRAVVGGFDVVRQPEQVRRLIGLTGQYAAVDELLSGEENLRMIGRLLGLKPKDARGRAAELLGFFDLAEAAKAAVKTYSGGMRRRLDLAASLVGRPQFLFLDEPTTGLDPRSRREVWTMIGGLVSGGTTVLLTTQYLEEADKLADRIVVVDHGRVVAAGTVDELKEKVGGQVLEVRPADEAAIPAATKIVTEIAGTESSIDEETQLITVPLADSALAAVAVKRLDKSNIPLAHLALRRPSLDEVFLALTGHPAEEDSQDEQLERSRT
jgi:oleandomycin transport system ATP-binding protein